MSKKHHIIPMQQVLLPGLFLVIGLFFLIFGKQNTAFFLVGIAIVVAILIHHEHK